MTDPDMWALFDMLPAPTYYAGNVVLIGDAAHASTPHQGAGAGQAMEDAFILSSLLGDEKTRCARNIEAAFRAYDAVRRPRSQKVVSTSRAAGATYAMQGPALDNLELIGAELVERYKWIWNEDLSLQAERARAALVEHPQWTMKPRGVKTSDNLEPGWKGGLWRCYWFVLVCLGLKCFLFLLTWIG